MKVIFSGSGYFSVNESDGVWLTLDGGVCSYGCVTDARQFNFSPGAYDYAGWLDAVCQMAIDAEQIHVTDVDGDVLFISTVGADGRHEARLKKTGECHAGNDIYNGSEK